MPKTETWEEVNWEPGLANYSAPANYGIKQLAFSYDRLALSQHC